MDAIRLREAARRDYREPTNFLRGLREIERHMDPHTAEHVRSLRTNGLKEWRETRLGALFCYGMSQLTGRSVYLSKGEFGDADFVGMWVESDVQHFAPVQLKELVTEDRNSSASLELLIDGLFKYSGAEDLTVLIHLNRQVRFDVKSISLPARPPIAALWVLGCTDPMQAEWAIWGDFLKQPEGTKFAYPT